MLVNTFTSVCISQGSIAWQSSCHVLVAAAAAEPGSLQLLRVLYDTASPCVNNISVTSLHPQCEGGSLMLFGGQPNPSFLAAPLHTSIKASI